MVGILSQLQFVSIEVGILFFLQIERSFSSLVSKKGSPPESAIVVRLFFPLIYSTIFSKTTLFTSFRTVLSEQKVQPSSQYVFNVTERIKGSLKIGKIFYHLTFSNPAEWIRFKIISGFGVCIRSASAADVAIIANATFSLKA